MRKILGRFDRRPSVAESIGMPKAPSASVAGVPKAPQATVSEADTREIPIDQIVPDPRQQRKSFPPESISEMAASLRARGQAQPILVWRDEVAGLFRLIFGERRLRGATEAGWATIRAEVFDGVPTIRQIRLMQFTENAQREDVPGLQEARSWSEFLAENDLTPAQFRDETGIKLPRITKALALVRNLIPEVQELVESGRLDKSSAYPISRLEAGEQLAMARLALSEDLSRDRVAAEVKLRLGGLRPVGDATSAGDDAVAPDAQAGESLAPGEPVSFPGKPDEAAHPGDEPSPGGGAGARFEVAKGIHIVKPTEGESRPPLPGQMDLPIGAYPPTPAQQLRREIRKAAEGIVSTGSPAAPHPIDGHLDRVKRKAEEGSLSPSPRVTAVDARAGAIGVGTPIAGWDGPEAWGESTHFDFDLGEAGGGITVVMSEGVGYAELAALLGRAWGAAKWRAALAAVRPSGARPGDRVEVIDPEEDRLRGVPGVIEDRPGDVTEDGPEARLWVRFEGRPTEVGTELRCYRGDKLRRFT